jgi:acylphosphatase
MSDPEQKHLSERMTISGHFKSDTFLPWIARHGAKLGLDNSVARAQDDLIELHLTGPEELIDMMEVGCSLGPIDAWIEQIERQPLGGSR